MKIDGIGVNDLMLYPEFIERALLKVKDLGIKSIRFDVPWYMIETKRGQYDWSRTDPIIKWAEKLGLNCLPVLDLPKPSFLGNTKIDSVAIQFGLFCAAFAKRYSYVVDYEICNEVNHAAMWNKSTNALSTVLGSALGTVSPGDYVKLLRAASQGIASAYRHGLGAGGIYFAGMAAAVNYRRLPWMNYTSMSASAYLDACFKAGLKPEDFTHVGYHPYPLGNDWSTAELPLNLDKEGNTVPHKQIDEILEIADVLVRAKVPVAIALTEWGFSSTDYKSYGGHDIRTQVFKDEFSVFNELEYQREISENYIHELRDYAFPGKKWSAKTRRQNYGVLNLDYSEKPVCQWIREVNGV